MKSRLQRLTRSKFVRDTFVLQLGRIGTTILSFISVWLIIRLMGVEEYGIWKLVLALVAIWQTLDITGIGQLTSNRLAIAVGRKDTSNALDLMAIYAKVVVAWGILSVVALFLIGPLVAAQLYDGNRTIGVLAGWFAFTLAADSLYTLVILSLQSRRLMRELALLQNLNQVVLFVCMVVAVLVSPTPEALVVARLVYSFTTLAMAFVLYGRLRYSGGLVFPAMADVFRRAATVSLRGYWRSGIAMALDKNIGNLFTQFPLTLVGVLAGPTAAGLLGIGLDVVQRSALLTGPVLENVQAVVPQSVGRGDFAGLQRNFGRVLLVMALGAVGFYGVLALVAPFVVPLVFGADTAPAVPVIIVLSLYGGVTAVGGLFGPLYRALDLVRAALIIKLVTSAIVIIPGVILISQLGEIGGAWLVNGLYILSVALTMLVTFPALRHRVAQQQSSL